MSTMPMMPRQPCLPTMLRQPHGRRDGRADGRTDGRTRQSLSKIRGRVWPVRRRFPRAREGAGFRGTLQGGGHERLALRRKRSRHQRDTPKQNMKQTISGGEGSTSCFGPKHLLTISKTSQKHLKHISKNISKYGTRIGFRAGHNPHPSGGFQRGKKPTGFHMEPVCCGPRGMISPQPQAAVRCAWGDKKLEVADGADKNVSRSEGPKLVRQCWGN